MKHSMFVFFLAFGSLAIFTTGCESDDQSSMGSAGQNDAGPNQNDENDPEREGTIPPLNCDGFAASPALATLATGDQLLKSEMSPCGHIFYVDDEGSHLVSPDLSQDRVIGPAGEGGVFGNRGERLVYSVPTDTRGVRTLYTVDLRAETAPQTMEVHAYGMFSYPDGSDGVWACSTMEEGGQLVRLEGDQSIDLAEGTACAPNTISFIKNQRILVLPQADQTVKTVDVVTGLVQTVEGVQLENTPAMDSGRFDRLSQSGDGQLLVHQGFRRFVDGDAEIEESTTPVRVFDLVDNTLLAEISGQPVYSGTANFTTAGGSTVFVQNSEGIVAVRRGMEPRSLALDVALHLFPDGDSLLGRIRSGDQLKVLSVEGEVLHDLGQGQEPMVSPNGVYIGYMQDNVNCAPGERPCPNGIQGLKMWSAEEGSATVLTAEGRGRSLLVTNAGMSLVSGQLLLDTDESGAPLAQEDGLALVSRDGHVLQSWPGTSRVWQERILGDGMVFEINRSVEDAAVEQIILVYGNGEFEILADAALRSGVKTADSDTRMMFVTQSRNDMGEPVYALVAGAVPVSRTE